MLGAGFPLCSPDAMRERTMTQKNTLGKEGDMATVETDDDYLDASTVFNLLMVAAMNGAPPPEEYSILLEELPPMMASVLIEIDGVITEANTAVFGIKDKKPYLRISNHMVDHTKTTPRHAG